MPSISLSYYSERYSLAPQDTVEVWYGSIKEVDRTRFVAELHAEYWEKGISDFVRNIWMIIGLTESFF